MRHDIAMAFRGILHSKVDTLRRLEISNLASTPCPLCNPATENVLWRDARCRVIRVEDADYPGFCRVIWQAHVAEMSDLDVTDRDHLMHCVFALEAAMRDCFAPRKINLASLGNQVPHLHWHVIARHADDAHFPDPVWATRKRDGAARPPVTDGVLRDALARALDVRR